MAEAAAAFYAVETAIEGAAVGAIAVSQSTVPLHLRFRKVNTTSYSFSLNTQIGHSLSIVKGKAYIFGGDAGEQSDTSMRVVTLPSDIENGESDFQLVEAELEDSRPLQQYASASVDSEGLTDALSSGTSEHNLQSDHLQPRAMHVSTSIDSNVFILAGRRPSPTTPGQHLNAPSNVHLFECDQLYVFSTQTNKWTIIAADIRNCKGGIPPPRTGASCTSTPHPQPDSAVDITIHAHGTIFVHGGYDLNGSPLRDTWAFNVSSRIWTQWPDVPDPLPEEVAGEGRITCVGNRLWQVGDGFGKVMYIDFDVIRGDVVGSKSGPHSAETAIMPQNAKWNILTFDEKARDTALQGEIGAGSEKQLLGKTENLPVPRQGAGFVPVKIGAGRSYLLYFMGSDGPGSVMGDAWSFQIAAEGKSPAAIKDAVRNAVGKGTGENQWARCEIIESTKEEGQVFPPRGLSGFAVDSWKDLGGGNLLLYGGIDTSGQLSPDCWILSVE